MVSVICFKLPGKNKGKKGLRTYSLTRGAEESKKYHAFYVVELAPTPSPIPPTPLSEVNTYRSNYLPLLQYFSQFIFCVFETTEYTEWQWPIFGVHSIMMEKSALGWWLWGVYAHALPSTLLPSCTKLQRMLKGRYTPCISFSSLLLYVLCVLDVGLNIVGSPARHLHWG